MTVQEDAMEDIGEEDEENNTYSPDDAEDEDGSRNQWQTLFFTNVAKLMKGC
jgi:hypothetical protein